MHFDGISELVSSLNAELCTAGLQSAAWLSMVPQARRGYMQARHWPLTTVGCDKVEPLDSESSATPEEVRQVI